MASLTLGGHTLLTPDGGGLLRQFTDCYISLSDLRLFGMDSIVRHTQRQDIGYPNYSAPHEFRLNTFYHYSGCSRWSFGLFVVDTETVGSIGTGEQSLEMDTSFDGPLAYGGFANNINQYFPEKVSSAWPFRYDVEVLEPRRISASGVNDAWLVPVVDHRYAWQFENVRITNTASWSAVYGALGISLFGSVDADYLLPNEHRIKNVNHNKAALADAVLWSTGQWYEPVYRQAHTWADATEINKWQCAQLQNDTQHRENYAILLAGAAKNITSPPGVTVKFQGYQPCKEITDVNVYSSGSGERTVYSTALGDFSGGGGTPANAGDLQTLASAINSDFNRAFGVTFDVTYAGVRNWFLTGNTDVAIYEFGADKATGKLSCQTRVQSLPYNFGCDFLLHEHADVNEHMARACKEGIVQTAISAPASPGGSATGTVLVYEAIGGSWTSTGETLTVTNRDDTKSWEPGEYISFCIFSEGECRPVSNPPDIDEDESGSDGDDESSSSDSGSASDECPPEDCFPIKRPVFRDADGSGSGTAGQYECPPGTTQLWISSLTGTPDGCEPCGSSSSASGSTSESQCKFLCIDSGFIGDGECVEESSSSSGSGVSPAGCVTISAVSDVGDDGNEPDIEDGGDYHGFGDPTGGGVSLVTVSVENNTLANIAVDLSSSGALFIQEGAQWTGHTITTGASDDVTFNVALIEGSLSEEITITIAGAGCNGEITFTLNGVVGDLP